MNNADIKKRLHEIQLELQICSKIGKSLYNDHFLALAQEIGELQNKMTIACTETGKNDAPQTVLDDYTLTFRDEFLGPELDCDKWKTTLVWTEESLPDHFGINSEEQFYVDVCNDEHNTLGLSNPFSFEDNKLVITANPEQAPTVLNGSGAGQQYTSGVIRGPSFMYGYLETCLKLPCGVAGTWAAFWLLNTYYVNNDPRATGANGKYDPEIDLEWVNNAAFNLDGTQTTFAYHYDNAACNIDASGFNCGAFGSAQSQQCDGTSINGSVGFPVHQASSPDWCNEFHTYAIHWCADRVEYLIDGQIVRSICDAGIVPQVPMYPILNLAMGGSYGGNTDPTQGPASMHIDYVRLYEKL